MKASNHHAILTELAERWLPALDQKVCRSSIAALLEEIAASQERQLAEGPIQVPDRVLPLVQVALKLSGNLGTREQLIKQVQERYTNLLLSSGSTGNGIREPKAWLDLLKLIAPALQKSDAAVFKRPPDFAVLRERFERWRHSQLRLAGFSARLFGGAVAEIIQDTRASEFAHFLLQKLNLEAPLLAFLKNPWQWQAVVAVLNAVTTIVRTLEYADRSDFLSIEWIRFVFKTCEEPNGNPWIQLACFELAILLDPDEALQNASQRLTTITPTLPDYDIFLRSSLMELLSRQLNPETVLPLLERSLTTTESSEHVSIQLVRMLPRFPGEQCWRLLIQSANPDREPRYKVRLAALISAIEMMNRATKNLAEIALPEAVELAQGALLDQHPLVIRGGLDLAVAISAKLGQDEPSAPSLEPLIAEIDRLLEQAADLRVRRWAAEARERFLVPRLPGFAVYAQEIAPRIKRLKPGGRLIVKNTLLPKDESGLGRIACYFSSNDFNVNLKVGKRRTIIQRDERFRRRLWRMVHELTHPTPDKRQDVSHTRGRASFGNLRAPSRLMAEAMPAKVVGEPLVGRDGTWRPFLPLLSDYLSLLNGLRTKAALTIVSAEGLTTVHPPRGPISRFKAWLTITFNYGCLAGLRVKELGCDSEAGDPLIEAMTKLGFTIEFTPHSSTVGERVMRSCDPLILKYFAVSSKPTQEARS